MKIMKFTSIILLVLLLSACSNKDNNEDKDGSLQDSISTMDEVTKDSDNDRLEVIIDNKLDDSSNANDKSNEVNKEEQDPISEDKKNKDSISEDKEEHDFISEDKVEKDSINEDKENKDSISEDIEEQDSISRDKEDQNKTDEGNANLEIISGEKEEIEATNETEMYNYTEEEMIDFLCYNKGDYSNWYEDNYVLVFQKDGIFSCYNASSGNPWFLQYGDTVEGKASYSIDTKNKQIVVKDYDKDFIINYAILTINKIEVKIDGIDETYYFSKRS